MERYTAALEPGSPMKNSLIIALALSIAPALGLSAGCQSAYYGTLEKFGVHKRDIMVDRVEEARDSQHEAKQQFASALEEFRSVVDVQADDLESTYDRLNSELERSESRADTVRKRIKKVESVSKALFKEWEGELDEYTNPSLEQASVRQLDETRRSYEVLMGAMKRAETKMEPVLAAFRDQVLFLKHNLNAQAIASLKGELTSLEGDIASLIRDMEASISEADAFIETMQSSS
jgi:hypothetical protein